MPRTPTEPRVRRTLAARETRVLPEESESGPDIFGSDLPDQRSGPSKLVGGPGFSEKVAAYW